VDKFQQEVVMSLRSIGAIAIFATAACCAAPAAWAQDPTIHQVYQAAEAGKFIEAQAMMDKVLRDHPKSGKAHYIQAELLAKQGKFAQAGTELASAERLAPGLPFAKPEAVEQLRALAARARKAPATPAATIAEAKPDLSYERQTPVTPTGGGLPWGMILAVGAVIVFAFAWFRRKSASQAVQQRYAQTAGPAGTPGAGAAYPQYANAGNTPFGPGAVPPGGGIGSGIMGGLATGAALGAGMVAGQALMHRFTDGNGNATGHGNNVAPGTDVLATPDPLFDTPPLGDDMGGADFGVSDAGSWDSGGSGGDEWN
jgi:hypothetical protein